MSPRRLLFPTSSISLSIPLVMNASLFLPILELLRFLPPSVPVQVYAWCVLPWLDQLAEENPSFPSFSWRQVGRGQAMYGICLLLLQKKEEKKRFGFVQQFYPPFHHPLVSSRQHPHCLLLHLVILPVLCLWRLIFHLRRKQTIIKGMFAFRKDALSLHFCIHLDVLKALFSAEWQWMLLHNMTRAVCTKSLLILTNIQWVITICRNWLEWERDFQSFF